jgi:hypothetical protein
MGVLNLEAAPRASTSRDLLLQQLLHRVRQAGVPASKQAMASAGAAHTAALAFHRFVSRALIVLSVRSLGREPAQSFYYGV